jgi:hypothetical protein
VFNFLDSLLLSLWLMVVLTLLKDAVGRTIHARDRPGGVEVDTVGLTSPEKWTL